MSRGWVKGEPKPNHRRFDDTDVARMKRMREQGTTVIAIAYEYKVSVDTISKILNGRMWVDQPHGKRGENGRLIPKSKQS